MLRARIACLAFLICFGAVPASASDITVFAAASLKTALDDISAEWRGGGGPDVSLTFAASSTIARQVDQGAPADVILLANDAWMDWLETRDAIATGSRGPLLGNRLVLVGSFMGTTPLNPAPGFPLAERLGSGKLAMALVDAVPVGIYGKAALENLGVWDQIATRVAQTDNARTALALVARGEAPMGIVYLTDARADPRVTILGVFAEDVHPPIRYPMALGKDASAAALEFAAFLRSEAAASIFRAQGFVVHD